HAERERQCNTDEPDAQGNLRAVEDAREDAAAELIRAEQVERVIFFAGAEEVRLAGDEGEEFVFVTLDEAAQGFGVGALGQILELLAFDGFILRRGCAS
ncbi:MAG: hypothetical protein EBY09_06375, partial [Verrucomicrobia bacterium]|nr:hypothetical protein [Verrucomicrobiota bacterium]